MKNKNKEEKSKYVCPKGRAYLLLTTEEGCMAITFVQRMVNGKKKDIEVYEEAKNWQTALKKLMKIVTVFLMFTSLSFSQCFQPNLETKIQLENKGITVEECFNIYTETTYLGKFPDARRGHLIKSNVYVTAFTVGKGEYRIYFADIDRGGSKLTIENCNKASFKVWQEVYEEDCRIEILNNNQCTIEYLNN